MAARKQKKHTRSSLFTKVLLLVLLGAIGLQLRSLHGQVQEAQEEKELLTQQVQAQQQENDALSQSRLRGINQVMSEEELSVEVVCNESPYALDDEALYGLLMRRPRPEVLLCSNNHLALHCLQYIRRIGLKVPQDIALLTFDNYPFSMLTDPAITAVEVDMHDMGVNAARFVLQRIRKPNLQTQSYCTSPCILEREST